jgi:hypothetical protein
MQPLAALSLRLGVTPQRLSELARIQFVLAAAEIAKKKASVRPNQSQIAAMTSLSRAEVRRILRDPHGRLLRRKQHTVPIYRLIDGWRAASKAGHMRLRALSVTGPFPSFAALCRKHAADTPTKAVIAELLRLELVKLNVERNAISLVRSRSTPASYVASLDALAFVASQLADLTNTDKIIARRQVDVSFDEAHSSIAERAIAQRIAGSVDQLSEMFPRRSESRKRTRTIRVYSLLSRS